MAQQKYLVAMNRVDAQIVLRMFKNTRSMKTADVLKNFRKKDDPVSVSSQQTLPSHTRGVSPH